MKWFDVQSSQLDSFGYQDNILFVRFNNGAVYGYDGVDSEDVVSVLFPEDGSHGKAFNKYIRGGKYAYRRLTTEEIEALG